MTDEEYKFFQEFLEKNNIPADEDIFAFKYKLSKLEYKESKNNLAKKDVKKMALKLGSGITKVFSGIDIEGFLEKRFRKEEGESGENYYYMLNFQDFVKGNGAVGGEIILDGQIEADSFIGDLKEYLGKMKEYIVHQAILDNDSDDDIEVEI